MAFVVEPEPPGDPGDEGIVERAVDRPRRRAEVVKGHIHGVVVPPQPPLPHHRRAGPHHRLHEVGDGAHRARGFGDGAHGAAHCAHHQARRLPGQVAADSGQLTYVVAQRLDQRLQRAVDGRRRWRGRVGWCLGGACEVHDVHGQRHASDAVGQRVVHLHHEGRAVLRQPLEEGELPQRAIVVEGAHAGHAGRLEHRVEAATSGDASAADVPREIEVRVHHPPRRREPKGRGDELHAERGSDAGGPLDACDELRPRRCPVEDHDRDDRRAQQRVALELHREGVDFADVAVVHRPPPRGRDPCRPTRIMRPAPRRSQGRRTMARLHLPASAVTTAPAR